MTGHPFFRFNVDNKESTTLSIHIKCTIVERVLEVIDPQAPGNQISKLSFDHVYYGSIVTKRIILFNNSPVASDFIITINEQMSECVNKSKNLAITLTKCDHVNEDQAITPSLDSIFAVTPKKVSIGNHQILSIQTHT